MKVELKFPAPSIAGHYTFTVIVRSDSYMDSDISKEIKVLLLYFHLIEYRLKAPRRFTYILLSKSALIEGIENLAGRESGARSDISSAMGLSIG